MSISTEQIRQMLEAGRGIKLDWLAPEAAPETIAASMAAMANSQGGVVLLGVQGDTPRVMGVDKEDEAIDRTLQAALSLEPALIIPLPQVVMVDEKRVVIVQIPSGMPSIYALDGRYMRRVEAENHTLKPHELRRLLIERGEVSFETEIAAGSALDDLDWDKVNHYIGKLGGIQEAGAELVLLKRGCLARDGAQMRPTNAGILLFGKDPQRFHRGADITAVRFAGEIMGDTFSRQDIIGTLPEQLRRAETFLVDHLRKGVQLRHTMARQESFEYPLEAARELVVNAVAHRDYSISGDGIRLFIFKDHMEVTSPGRLPGPVTIDNIREERFSRNPAIVQVLSDLGFIERLGYGVDRVIELMQQQKLRQPEFCETNGGFRVTLYNQRSESAAEQPGQPHTTGEIAPEYEGIPINSRQEAALAYLRQPGKTRITNSELQRLYPEVHAETIRRDLADLVTKNILNKMGQKRGSYYVLKRQTEAKEGQPKS
jgi:ATP-dependent DNA helicase RecG